MSDRMQSESSDRGLLLRIRISVLGSDGFSEICDSRLYDMSRDCRFVADRNASLDMLVRLLCEISVHNHDSNIK